MKDFRVEIFAEVINIQSAWIFLLLLFLAQQDQVIVYGIMYSYCFGKIAGMFSEIPNVN